MSKEENINIVPCNMFRGLLVGGVDCMEFVGDERCSWVGLQLTLNPCKVLFSGPVRLRPDVAHCFPDMPGGCVRKFR